MKYGNLIVSSQHRHSCLLRGSSDIGRNGRTVVFTVEDRRAFSELVTVNGVSRFPAPTESV